jgi:hypothetical protein
LRGALATKQSILSLRGEMDCFVAEFIIGPAEGRTRWLLAMTRGNIEQEIGEKMNVRNI